MENQNIFLGNQIRKYRKLRKLTQELTATVTNFGDWWDMVMKTREQAQLLADALNIVKNAVITLMALRFAEWLFVAGNAMRLLNLAMSENPYVLLAIGLGTLALHLKDLQKNKPMPHFL